MPHSEELLAALLATRATGQLDRARPVPWADLEHTVHCDLTGTSEQGSKARFLDSEGAWTPQEWLEAIGGAGARGVGLKPVAAAGSADRPVEVGGQLVDAHKLHAFAGTGSLLLAVSLPERLIQFRTRIWLPPETTLACADVLAFVAGRETADELRDALLWQDKHNLHVTDGESWARFVAALRPEHDEALVRAMDMSVHNVRFTRGEAAAWRALKRAQANPDRFWQFEFVRQPDGAGGLQAEPVLAQSERLRRALVPIEQYAREIGEDAWAGAFQAARAALDGSGPVKPPASWFEGAGMGDGALRLLTATIQADVFGGMGSWNDLSPVDAPRYDALSAALFRELEPSLLSAVNESLVPAG